MSLQGNCSKSKGGLEVEEITEEDGCDELGSRLEEELNRSIEKLREEEEAAVSSVVAAASQREEAEKEVANIHVEMLIRLSDSLYSSEDPSANATPKSSSSLSTHSPMELLQDVEMPTCNISCCDATKLSSDSPSTSNDAIMITAQKTRDPQHAVTESTTLSLLETAVLEPTSSSPLEDTCLSDSVFSKEEEHHTGGSPQSFFELLQDIEMPSYNMSSCESSKLPSFPSTSPTTLPNRVSGEGDNVKTASEAVSIDNSGVSGASPQHFRGTMEAVDTKKMNTRFHVISPIKKLHPQATHHPSASSPTIPEMTKQGNDTISSSTIMSEAILVLSELEKAATNLISSPESPNRRITIHPLDMEGINDSLLGSPLRHAPKSLVPQDLLLPSISKKEGSTDPHANNTAMKENTIGITKLLNVRSELNIAPDMETLALNATAKGCSEIKKYAATETNQTFLLGGNPVIEGETAASMTGICKESTAETIAAINTTYDFKLPSGKENAAVENTLDFKLSMKKKIPVADTTFSVPGKEIPATSTTFDFNKVTGKENPFIDPTFDCNKLPADRGIQLNTTFEHKKPEAGENQAANTTFITDDMPTGRMDHQAAANTTFDCNQDRNGGMNTTFTATQKQNSQVPSTPKSKGNELNVTFEKGEYRIGDQNETVNLMDVEESVLQVILDATPKKVSHQVPRAASTPKPSEYQHKPHLKAGLTKASPMNFLYRLMDGTKQEVHQEHIPTTTLSSTSTTTTTTTTDLPSFPSSLKFGGGRQQQQQQQLQRHHGSVVVRPGPMKALPLSTRVTNAAHLQEHLKSAVTGSGDEHSGGSTSSTKGTLAQRRRTITVPSFGSISSIESDDMSGPPDCVINQNTSISSPETFRTDVLSCGPRITSTPTFGGHRVFPDMMKIDGGIPTPISQISSRPCFSELISSSFQGSSNGSLEKEGATQKASGDHARQKNLPDQPSPVEAEVPILSHPPHSPSTLPAPPSTLQPSSAGPVLPSTSQLPSAAPVLPSILQSPSSHLTQPASSQSDQLPFSHPADPSLSQPYTSQVTSYQPSQQSTSQLSWPSSPIPPKKLQIENDDTKRSNECGEQQKPYASENEKLDVAQKSVPQTAQTPFSQTAMNVKERAAQTPSVAETQPPAQPSSPLPSPSGTTNATETTCGTITAPTMQSSLLPTPPTTNTTVQPSSPSPSPPHAAATKEPQTAGNDEVNKTKPRESTLVLPSTTKTALLATGAWAKKNEKLKIQSSLQKLINTRGKQLQPVSSKVDKENRRKSVTVDNKRTQSPPSPRVTTRQPPQRAPLLSKRNSSSGQILKLSNTNVKETINKPKLTNRALVVTDIPMKGVPQGGTAGIVSAVKSIPKVQTEETGSAKDKRILRKPSLQSHRNLSRTLSGSELPKNKSALESTKPLLKTLPNHSKKLPLPLKRPEMETVGRSRLPSLSGRRIPVTHSSKNLSTVPHDKATSSMRSGEVLQQKPS